MQHWLKILHRFRGSDQRLVGDPHRLNVDGEPLMKPAYEPGDLMLVYVAGTFRCPGAVEVVAPAAFDPSQRRWGWRTEVRLVAMAHDLDAAPTLDDVGIPSSSVGRQSRLRLRPEQFERGLATLDHPQGV